MYLWISLHLATFVWIESTEISNCIQLISNKICSGQLMVFGCSSLFVLDRLRFVMMMMMMMMTTTTTTRRMIQGSNQMPNAVRKGVHTQSTSLLQDSISTNPKLQRTHSSDSSVSKLEMHAQSGGFLSRMDRAAVGSSWPVFFHWSKLVFRNLVQHFLQRKTTWLPP